MVDPPQTHYPQTIHKTQRKRWRPNEAPNTPTPRIHQEDGREGTGGVIMGGKKCAWDILER